MFALLLVLTVFSGLLLACLLYSKFFTLPQVLKKNGIHGPQPTFFYGNYKQRIRMGSIQFLRHIHEQYGPIAGFYLGRRAQVSVTDTDLLKKILVKDFNCFVDKDLPMTILNFEGLLTTRGDKWRFMRHTLSPTFSSSKLKAIMPTLLTSVDNLVEVFKGRVDTDKSIDLLKVYSSFTMESIFAAAFGRRIEIQKGQSNPLVEVAVSSLTTLQEDSIFSPHYLSTIFSNLPWLAPIVAFLSRFSPQARGTLILCEAVEQIIQIRRKEKGAEKYKDLLQLMIDASAEGGKHHGQRLTDSQIMGNALTFMLAGYDTTANTLGCTSYLLALHPHVQERLQQEIDQYFQQNPDVSLYQAVQDLEYLDMVLQESLRIYPPAPIFNRDCTEDYSDGGITIPKNTTVIIPVGVLHHLPHFWTDPETFDPLRFSAEEKEKRPQFCYLPFGHGPRSCIGSRFALLEAKLALVQLLRRFSFVRAPETRVPLEIKVGISMICKSGIHLKVVSRSSSK